MTKKTWTSLKALNHLLIVSLILLALGSGCDVLRLGKTFDEIEEGAKGIGKDLGSGLVAGLDTSQMDSLVKRLTKEIGNSLNEEIDEVSIQNLEDQLSGALRKIIAESKDSIQAILADTTAFNDLDSKLQSIVGDLVFKINKAVSGIIPNALNDQNMSRIYGMRDELLGPATAKLLEEALKQSLGNSMKDLMKSEELDSLIKKIADIVDDASETVDQSVFKIKKGVVTAGAIIGGVLLLLLLFLWLRKRSQARQQKELLVNLTKAIDAIPTKDDYDHTVAYLQEQISSSNDIKQSQMLEKILNEYKDQYPQKKKYKVYYERMIEKIKEADQDGTVSRQILSDNNDEGFESFVRDELK